MEPYDKGNPRTIALGEAAWRKSVVARGLEWFVDGNAVVWPADMPFTHRNRLLAQFLKDGEDMDFEEEQTYRVEAAALKLWTEAGCGIDDFAALNLFERACQGSPYRPHPTRDGQPGFYLVYPSIVADLVSHGIVAAKAGNTALHALYQTWWPSNPRNTWRVRLGRVRLNRPESWGPDHAAIP